MHEYNLILNSLLAPPPPKAPIKIPSTIRFPGGKTRTPKPRQGSDYESHDRPVYGMFVGPSHSYYFNKNLNEDQKCMNTF